MIVDETTRYAIGKEAIRHCECLWQWWPGIKAKDTRSLEEANTYLGFLAADNDLMYRIVMAMISKQTGVDWNAFRRAS